MILPLRVSGPVACSRMLCAQLRAARMIAKKRRGRPERETDRRMDGHIVLTVPHWGPSEPSVGIIDLMSSSCSNFYIDPRG